jgi:hypothetical protein
MALARVMVMVIADWLLSLVLAALVRVPAVGPTALRALFAGLGQGGAGQLVLAVGAGALFAGLAEFRPGS